MQGAPYRRVRVYAAGATARGVLLDTRVWTRWINCFVTALGGTATVYPAAGVWLGTNEPTMVIEAVLSFDSYPAMRARLDAELQRFLAATCQTSALVTVEDVDARLVTAHDSEGVVSCV